MSAIRLIFLMFSLLLSAFVRAEVQVLLDENFDNWDPAKTPGIHIGSQAGGAVGVSTEQASQINLKSVGALKATYPKGVGEIYGWAGFDMKPYSTYEVYIEFNAKMPKAKQGLKFLKIFGQRDALTKGYANTTFALAYTNVVTGKGSMHQVSFGDGSTAVNDTQSVINFDGTYPGWIGRSYGKAVVKTPEGKAFSAAEWGEKWHHFKFKVKFNSVTKNSDNTYTEINDGEYYVEIDGKVYVDATGLLNRHPSNGPIDKVAFLDWSQSIDEPFEVWYDNVKITTGGFDNAGPSEPQNIKIQ